MDDSRNQPEIETLGYKPGDRIKKHPFPTEQPASAPPATLGFNSVVIRPEIRANKAKDACQHFQESLCREPEPEQLPERLHTEECECGNCPEQPNQNIMIIEEIEGLLSQVNGKLDSLPTQEIPINQWNKQKHYKSQALEETDLFQKTTLFELRKAYE